MLDDFYREISEKEVEFKNRAVKQIKHKTNLPLLTCERELEKQYTTSVQKAEFDRLRAFVSRLESRCISSRSEESSLRAMRKIGRIYANFNSTTN